MPGKRKDGKKNAQAWLRKKLFDAVLDRAEKDGVNVSDFVVDVIEKNLKELGYDIEDDEQVVEEDPKCADCGSKKKRDKRQ